VVTSCITPLVVDRLGRKLLMWTTSLGLTIFLGIIGVYALLDSHYKYDVAHVAFIPLLCLIIYMILFTLATSNCPTVIWSCTVRNLANATAGPRLGAAKYAASSAPPSMSAKKQQ
ncbi:Facilitated trehalose transporter Tret1-1, partial [Papilio xuthus]